MKEPIHVTDAAFEKAVLKSPVPVIVDFWAPWCGPCRMVAPALEKIASEYENKIIVAKVNTDENPEWAMKYGVQGIPAVKVFRDGKVAGEFVGALPEPKVREFIKKYAPNQSDLILTAAQDLARAKKWAEAEAAYRRTVLRDGPSLRTYSVPPQDERTLFHRCPARSPHSQTRPSSACDR